MHEAEVLIIGGGIAGLCCARQLQDSGVPCKVLEAADEVGGRVRTELLQGFRLDRGFQVLLTEYPEAKKVLDYEKLKPGSFEPGALVRFGGRFHRFVDPWRRPGRLFETAMSPIASFADKLRVARLRSRVCRGSIADLAARPETTTMERLREYRFSDQIIERFFRPFLGGVFLEGELGTTSRKFEFVFRMFSQGDAVLPSDGMGAIARQLADDLSPNTIETNAKVIQVDSECVRLDDGREWSAAQVVLACEAPVAAKLLGQPAPPAPHGVTCLYFSADSPPIQEPILVLNGEGKGPINNLCVPSQVVSGYAPEGKSLISVTVLGATAEDQLVALRDAVRDQLRDWFGADVDHWEHLKT